MATKTLTDYTKTIDPREVESGPFAGTRLIPCPAHLTAARKSLRYKAEAGDELGDKVIIDGDEFLFAPRAFTSMLRIADLKTPAWFRNNFDVPTRDSMFNEIVQEKESLDLKFFFQDSPEGPRIVNVIEASKMLLTDYELLAALQDVLPDGIDKVSDLNSRYHDGSLIIDFTLPIEREVNPELGDAVRLGATIRNSQVGFASPRADGYVYRLSCKNGATTGSKLDAWARGSSDESITMTDLKEWYRSTIREVLAESDRFMHSAEVARRTPAGTILQETAIQHRLSGTVLKDIYQAYMLEPLLEEIDGNTISTLWSVGNAFTRAAQTYDETTRRKLETIGGELMFGRN